MRQTHHSLILLLQDIQDISDPLRSQTGDISNPLRSQTGDIMSYQNTGSFARQRHLLRIHREEDEQLVAEAIVDYVKKHSSLKARWKLPPHIDCEAFLDSMRLELMGKFGISTPWRVYHEKEDGKDYIGLYKILTKCSIEKSSNLQHDDVYKFAELVYFS